MPGAWRRAGELSPDVLRQHCEAVGRDYGQIEKTTMLIIGPAITEPARIIDLLATALPELS